MPSSKEKLKTASSGWFEVIALNSVSKVSTDNTYLSATKGPMTLNLFLSYAKDNMIALIESFSLIENTPGDSIASVINTSISLYC